jgi:UDP:flavonoid glycosyltransferase YjiC (YdhE family)
MRFLISVAPAASHLQPVVPIARELRRRGHAVGVISTPSFRPEVEALGLDSISAGLDWLRAEPERFFSEFRAVLPGQSCDWLIAHVYASEMPRRLYPEIIELCREWRPDAILRDQAEFASWLAAERLGIPHASYGYGLGQLESELALMRPPLAALRQELGFAPDDQLDTLYRHLRLEFAPASYLPASARRIPHTHHLRFEPPDDGGELPESIGRLGAQPLVVVTFGNNYNRIPGLFESIIEALSDEGVDLVFAIGRNRRAEEFGALPPNVHVEPYVPLSRLLPRADLLLCHAGFNTIMTAVITGTPMVLLPIDSDQPVHAESCRALGMARVIEKSAGFGADWRREVRAALADPELPHAVARFREALLALPGAPYAANLMESLAADGS